jgi:hypothetical protein
MAVSSSPQAGQSPFDFLPRSTQDIELLRQFSFVPGLKEILMLRQVHALEHATVWILGARDSGRVSPEAVPPIPTARAPFSNGFEDNSGLLGGMSTSEGFYLYGSVELVELRRAAHQALRRLVTGEWNLAVHPRCGTNLSVGMLLTAGLALGMHLVLPRGPIEQLLGLGLATATAAHLAPEVGGVMQQYVTTAIPFNLAIVDIVPSHHYQGVPTHFVRVKWIEP